MKIIIKNVLKVFGFSEEKQKTEKKNWFAGLIIFDNPPKGRLFFLNKISVESRSHFPLGKKYSNEVFGTSFTCKMGTWVRSLKTTETWLSSQFPGGRREIANIPCAVVPVPGLFPWPLPSAFMLTKFSACHLFPRQRADC